MSQLFYLLLRREVTCHERHRRLLQLARVSEVCECADRPCRHLLVEVSLCKLLDPWVVESLLSCQSIGRVLDDKLLDEVLGFVADFVPD